MLHVPQTTNDNHRQPSPHPGCGAGEGWRRVNRSTRWLVANVVITSSSHDTTLTRHTILTQKSIIVWAVYEKISMQRDKKNQEKISCNLESIIIFFFDVIWFTWEMCRLKEVISPPVHPICNLPIHLFYNSLLFFNILFPFFHPYSSNI